LPSEAIRSASAAMDLRACSIRRLRLAGFEFGFDHAPCALADRGQDGLLEFFVGVAQCERQDVG
jgi:hypothetical protein